MAHFPYLLRMEGPVGNHDPGPGSQQSDKNHEQLGAVLMHLYGNKKLRTRTEVLGCGVFEILNSPEIRKIDDRFA